MSLRRLSPEASRADLVGFLFERRGAYRAVFETPVGKEVLEDLARFCGEEQTSFNENALRMAYMAGRHDVVLHIRRVLGEDDLSLERRGAVTQGESEW